ncbi:hypothetical protein M5D96_001934 [Drosophila gunungcola]|uniref:Uncharacterized protein n=1 Tax=Drosophila gunungcola TaxID=103775 RepID=A0A9P9YZE7_9MUSC|nr:hypothetical protein M5D96_001934 [Drosophila gunungcola]
MLCLPVFKKVQAILAANYLSCLPIHLQRNRPLLPGIELCVPWIRRTRGQESEFSQRGLGEGNSLETEEGVTIDTALPTTPHTSHRQLNDSEVLQAIRRA